MAYDQEVPVHGSKHTTAGSGVKRQNPGYSEDARNSKLLEDQEGIFSQAREAYDLNVDMVL
jgi:hypothetical protein